MPHRKIAVRKAIVKYTEQTTVPLFICPISKEALEHINQLFCYHLFIFMPIETKANILLSYLQQQEKWKSENAERLFSLYVTELMIFQEAVLKNDTMLFIHWEKMYHLTQQIHVEMKNILKVHHHDEILPSETIISFEAVLKFSRDIQVMQSKGLTFLSSGR
jgi:hypothetical protein